MKKTETTPMHCSLCGAEHNDDRVVKDGWFAEYKRDKSVKPERLICPACLSRLGVKANQS